MLGSVVMASHADPVGSKENPIPRRAARILLIDGEGRVLMFRGFDPARTEWEETGLAMTPESLGPPIWHQSTDFPFDGRWYRQEQEFFAVRVESVDISVDGFDAVERRSIDGHRWWSVEELAKTDERFYPAALPELLREILGA